MQYNINDLLSVMVEAQASDMYLSIATFPLLKVGSRTLPLEKSKLDLLTLETILKDMLNEKQILALYENKELDFTLSRKNLGRFRVNAFFQRGSVAFVFRRITSKISTLDELGMPEILKTLINSERGLILVVGSTGSGKSTTMAAMLDHRNRTSFGHILTLEDPVEFLHNHEKSIVNQREIGMDTASYSAALKSALRQAPDMLLIGEIRDQETMKAALDFSETGHLVLSTLHSNNAYQTLERIMGFFPREQHHMIQLQLSLNLKAVVGQRLIPTTHGKRTAALELMLSTGRIRDLIHSGDIETLRTTIEMSNHEGMQTFDQALHILYKDEVISMEDAIQYADRANDLKLLIHSEQNNLNAANSDIELESE